MSRIEELFGLLESHEFAAIVNLASNFKTFVRILEAQQAVQDLDAGMRSPDVRTAVRERALSLAKDQGEEGYEYPWDCPLAAYLWLLTRHDAEIAAMVAANIVTARGCWWARKMADELLSSEQRNGHPQPTPMEEKLTTG